MPIPNLLHPVPVTVQPIDRENTIVDTGYGEEYEVVARTATVVLPGQVKWGGFDRFRATDAGPEEGEDGYVLFRAIDLRAKSLATIKRGDRFIALGGSPNSVATDVYVTRVRFEGHYPDQKGPTLLKAFFTDRQPVKGAGEGLT
jgi:hypothetical protein